MKKLLVLISLIILTILVAGCPGDTQQEPEPYDPGPLEAEIELSMTGIELRLSALENSITSKADSANMEIADIRLSVADNFAYIQKQIARLRELIDRNDNRLKALEMTTDNLSD